MVPVGSDWSRAFMKSSSPLEVAIPLKALVEEFPPRDRGMLFSKVPVFSCQNPSCLPNCLLLYTSKKRELKSLYPWL